MAIATYPTASSGGIKSVQRGQAVSSGNIAITSVDTAKTFVRSISEGASGTVATDSTVSSHNISVPDFGISDYYNNSTLQLYNGTAKNTTARLYGFAHTSTAASAAISGGTTNLYTKEYGVYLSNSTTLVATGACRWEVVEFA